MHMRKEFIFGFVHWLRSRAEQQAASSSLPPSPSSPSVLSVQQYALQGPPPRYSVSPPPFSPAADADTEDLVAAREQWPPASYGPVRTPIGCAVLTASRASAMDALSDASISDDGFGQDGGRDSPAIGHDTPHACEAEIADQVCQASPRFVCSFD